MNPVFPLYVLVPLSIVAIGWTVFSAWRGGTGLSGRSRTLLVALRTLAFAAVLALLFNPGKWVQPSEQRMRPWIVLADVSSSMARPAGDSGTRAEETSALATRAAEAAESAGVPLRIQPFSSAPAAPVPAGKLPRPDGESTRILDSISRVLQEAGATGEALAGIVVIGDGRTTEDLATGDLDSLALRARGLDTKVHTVTVGADSAPPDLILHQSRTAMTAFPGQSLRIPFAIESRGLEPRRVTVTLRSGNSAEIASIPLDLPAGKTVTAAFETSAPAASERWSLDTPALPEEVRKNNNASSLNVRILDSKTRVFLAEGAPYWDSKFLAQLLRQQPYMDVHSVHRLSEKRYFRIDSGSADPSETDHPVFPATVEELARYDLIVLGKNVDPFLSAGRAEALRSYVRDHGGAVIFARGRPTTGDDAGLEPLEPVIWASATATDFRFVPNRDGEAAGLFGEALPAPDSRLWASLPTLKDGRQVSLVKPFTRVLADGVPEAGGMSGKFPALLMRRYGQGVTGLVNGDGLWKWDFYPEARELGNCYEDFWTQLIQWMASYSEFLPGQDFSLRLPATRGTAGAPVPAVISFRGVGTPSPVFQVTSPSGAQTRVQPTARTDASGRPVWHASFTPDAPGDWKLTVIDNREKAPPAPEVLFNVPRAPLESDDLSPDPVFMESIAAATGGLAMMPTDFASFLESRVVAVPPASRETGAVWQASWNHAAVALAIVALLAAEWFIRRREGLA